MLIKDLEMHKDLTSDELAKVRGGKDVEADLKMQDFDTPSMSADSDYRNKLPRDLRNALSWLIG